MALKFTLRQLPHLLYQIERLAGWLWDLACSDKATCWLDFLPALTYAWRKWAERLYVSRYSENIYGEKWH